MWRAEIKKSCQWSIVIGIILTYFIITHQTKLLHKHNEPFTYKNRQSDKQTNKQNSSSFLEKKIHTYHLRNVDNSVFNTIRKFIKVKITLLLACSPIEI